MANMFKHEIEKKIPAQDKTVSYKLLLEIVEKRNLRNKEELLAYLTKRETELQEQLRTHTASGTNTDTRRKIAAELELLAHCKPYLHHL